VFSMKVGGLSAGEQRHETINSTAAAHRTSEEDLEPRDASGQLFG